MSEGASIILCPGQGAQHTGMGKAWAEASDVAAGVYKAADDALGVELSKVCFEGPDEQVNRTDFAQAAIYVTSVACVRAMEDRCEIDTSNLGAAAGLSLGEYTALHLAGVFSFEDGLDLVWQRGRFMQDAAEASDGGMVAIIGADEAQVDTLCDAARGDDVLVGANYNCPGQIVISGSSVACDRAVAEAGNLGMRATKLTVAGAFHSPLMDPAAAKMADALAAVDFNAPALPVLSNVTGEVHGTDTDTIKKLLVDQITHPVRWEQNVRWLLANACSSGRYVEPAPGKVLSGLMRRIDRKTKVQNYAEPS